ncbi:MAG: preprotein translocase subunit SecG [Caldisericales bacterium]|nr:preprotein translocase subunit SecG [Caldisericales bacterium]
MALFRNIMMLIAVLTGIGMVLGYILSSPKASGLGAIGGTAQKFKVRKARDIFLDKIILWCAIAFGLCAFILSVVDPSIWTK